MNCGCCALVSDALTPLDAPASLVVATTDASTRRGAVVEATVSLEEAAWLLSRSSRRSGYARMTDDVGHDGCGELVPADDIMHEWMAGTQFSSAVSYKFGQAGHVNLRAAKDRRM